MTDSEITKLKHLIWFNSDLKFLFTFYTSGATTGCSGGSRLRAL